MLFVMFYFVLFFPESLTTDADETTVSNAVNALPVFATDESVTVVRQQTVTPTFQFTFVSNRGKSSSLITT